MSKVRTLLCSCCGAVTEGRQWWNRDTGYGLCTDCIDFCSRGTSAHDMQSCYGYRGIHYDLGFDFLSSCQAKESIASHGEQESVSWYLEINGVLHSFISGPSAAKPKAEEIYNQLTGKAA